MLRRALLETFHPSQRVVCTYKVERRVSVRNSHYDLEKHPPEQYTGPFGYGFGDVSAEGGWLRWILRPKCKSENPRQD